MSIKLYCGIMGSGKSYEVVTEVILSSLRQGRRVISNIAGLNFDVMKALLVDEGVPENLIGQLVTVTHEQVKEPIFWRTDSDDETGRKPVISKGDVVCLDENWRFWDGYNARDEEGARLPVEVKNFFRMHRQFPDPVTGFTCEIALISQDPSDFSRFVKGVVEQIFVMTKLTTVGMDNRYRVDIYARKITRKPIRSLQRSYDPKFFPCYKSHSQQEAGAAQVVERSADDRGNILKGAMFKVGLPIALLLFVVGLVGIWKFFHKGQVEEVQEVRASDAVVSPAVQAQAVRHEIRPEVVSDWRVLGWYAVAGGITVTLQNASGRIRVLVNPPVYKISAAGVEVELPEGGFATPWQSFGGGAGGVLR